MNAVKQKTVLFSRHWINWYFLPLIASGYSEFFSRHNRYGPLHLIQCTRRSLKTLARLL